MFHPYVRALAGWTALPLALLMGLWSSPAAAVAPPHRLAAAAPGPDPVISPAEIPAVDPLLTVTTQATHNPDYNFATAPARLSYTTPAYYSMDQPRSVELNYSSEQAHPMGLVQLGVYDQSGTVPVYYTLRLVRPNNSLVTFINGATLVHYAGGVSNRPITAQFDAATLVTGAYSYTAVVAAVYADSTRRETSHPVRVVVLNERNSELAWGWSISGLNRLYVQTDGAVVTTGSGQAGFFSRTCSTCAFVSPPGDFTKLRVSGSNYVRTHPDSTREIYNSAGRMIYLDDRVGNRTAYSYDASNRIASITDPAGLATTFAYDAAGKLASITAPGGRVVYAAVTTANLLQIQDPRGTALTVTYSGNRRVSTATNRNGGVTTFHYHASGSLDSVRLASVPVLRNGTEVSVRPTWRYNSFEEVVLPPAGTGTAAVHAPQVSTQATTTTDPRGATATTWINKFGLPLSVARPGGGFTTWLYDEHAKPIYRRDPGGRESFAWWTGPRLDSTRDASTERRVRYQYGAFNQITQVSAGTVTQLFTLNAQGLVQYASVNGGLPAAYTYDSRGRVTEIHDPMGHKTRAYYSPAGWMNADSIVGDTAGLKTAFGYDGYGRVRTVTDALQQVTTLIPDALNRDSLVITAAQDTTRYTYTGDYVTGVTLPGGVAYGYTVNALGWVRTQTGPAPGTLYAYYDENGNVTRTINRRTQAVAYGYDALNRMVSRTADGQTSTFAFDSLGLWMAASNPEATDTTWFNAAGQKVRAVTRMGGDRFARSYNYDSGGRRAGTYVDSDHVRAPGHPSCEPKWYMGGGFGKQQCLNHWSITLGYDAQGEVNGVNAQGEWFDGTDEYDPNAYESVFVLSGVYGFNDDRMLTTTTTGALTASREFDRLHSVKSLSFSIDSINTALGGRYDRDLLGRATRRYDPGFTGLRFFGYDSRGQLSSFGKAIQYAGQWVGTENWASPFDRAGNPTDSGAVVLPVNRLERYRASYMEYDADGNMIVRVRDDNSVEQYLEWNSRGQLTYSVDFSQHQDAAYGYDAYGRRVRRTINGLTQRYLWDDDTLLAEVLPGGYVKRAYVYFPGTQVPMAMLQNDSVYYYLTDEPGNVVGLVRPNGSLANRYEYTPFGELRFVRESVPNDLRFGSQLYDAESGMYYFRARYYDPYLRRFASQDPMGLAGGANLYAYVGNDPINFYDPTGMSAEGGECRYVPAREKELGARQDGYGQWWKIQCPTIYVGVTGTAAIPGLGITFGIGNWESGNEQGRYLRIGYATGLEASGGGEGGKSDPGAFFGTAVGGCMSWLILGGCVSGSLSGVTHGGTLSGSPVPFLPVQGHVEVSHTFNLGSRPAPPPYSAGQFLRDAYNALTFQGLRN